MRVDNTWLRWTLCFLVLPTLWILGSLATDLQAVTMIPAAIVIALLSALTALRSGRRAHVVAGYFIGTGAMMVIAFGIAIVAIWNIICWGVPAGECD